jgi:DNA polymerase-3 subunit delta'
MSEPLSEALSETQGAQFYPWHKGPRSQLLRQHSQGKLAHALLLCGQANLGKRDFAGALAHLLLCRDPVDELACGHCPGCDLFRAGTHPDFRVVKPEEPSKQIKIDQVRDLINWSGHTAQRNGWKIAIIHPAETMNNATANALLKRLEEPAGRSLFMLVTHQPSRLLPTIRSRCQRVEFVVPDATKVIGWLQERLPAVQNLGLLLSIAGGEPLTVVNQFSADYLQRRQVVIQTLVALVSGQMTPAQAYARVAVDEPGVVLKLCLDLVADCLKWHGSKEEKYIKNKDMKSEVNAVCGALDGDQLFQLMDRLMQEQRQLTSPSNPNPQLLLEALFVAIHQRRMQLIL